MLAQEDAEYMGTLAEISKEAGSGCFAEAYMRRIRIT